MTRNELDEILHQCYSVEIFPEEAAELIWGKAFDGETEKVADECPDHGINPKLCKWMRHAPLIQQITPNPATSPDL